MTDTKPRAVRRLGDIVFANLAFFAGVSILATLATVAAFLFAQSVPAFTGPPIDAASEGFFSYVLPFVLATVYALGYWLGDCNSPGSWNRPLYFALC